MLAGNQYLNIRLYYAFNNNNIVACNFMYTTQSALRLSKVESLS